MEVTEALSTRQVSCTFVRDDFLFSYPKLDTRISVLRNLDFVTLRLPPPLDSETGWSGELWLNPILLLLALLDGY